MNEREQLDERYLEAQLREELGIHPDLSEDVLQRVYAQPPRRIIPPPRRRPAWKPLAAAASVLLVAGLATFALIKVLPGRLEQEQAERRQPVKEERKRALPPLVAPEPDSPRDEPEPKDAPETQPGRRPDDQIDTPPAPEEEGEGTVDVVPPEPDAEAERPDGGKLPPDDRGWTDPPGAWPEPGKRKGDTAPIKSPLLVSAWNGEGIKVNGNRVEAGEACEIRAGDKVWVKGHADFTLIDGTLLRVDGEVVFEGDAKAISVQLDDGALYADTASPLRVAGNGVSAAIDGMGVFEERLNGLDCYCLRGRMTAGEHVLGAGYRSRLDEDGFGREKAITWPDVQREFRFLKDVPARALLREDLDDAPGELFGGAIKDGVLRGEADGSVGIGFYLREPHTISDGDVVRFRFRVETACELILQFGTVENANWRHKMGGVKAGEWIEYELPLRELYKTTDVARKAEAGLQLKFFQLHPEDTTADIQVDWVEILRKP